MPDGISTNGMGRWLCIQDQAMEMNIWWTLFHSGEQWEYREGHNRDLIPDELCTRCGPLSKEETRQAIYTHGWF